jgi:hypothetical protein
LSPESKSCTLWQVLNASEIALALLAILGCLEHLSNAYCRVIAMAIDSVAVAGPLALSRSTLFERFSAKMEASSKHKVGRLSENLMRLWIQSLAADANRE